MRDWRMGPGVAARAWGAGALACMAALAVAGARMAQQAGAEPAGEGAYARSEPMEPIKPAPAPAFALSAGGAGQEWRLGQAQALGQGSGAASRRDGRSEAAGRAAVVAASLGVVELKSVEARPGGVHRARLDRQSGAGIQSCEVETRWVEPGRGSRGAGAPVVVSMRCSMPKPEGEKKR